jgi:tetratricopeptide (TPR) repeat protein
MGPFGPAGVLLTQGIKPWYDRSAMAFEKWYATLFPEEALKFDARLYRRIQAEEQNPNEPSGLVPFIDILSFGSRKQKQAAIALITNNYQSSFAQALKIALNIGDSAIRVQAATAIARIENQFLERALELGQKAKEEPESPELKLALARHYDAYAFAGILDESREEENRELAVEYYKGYLELKPEDLVGRAELGRLLVRKGEFRDAAATLEHSIARGDLSPQISLWYMESLYHLGRLADLRTFVSKHSGAVHNREELPIEVGETFKLWGSTGKGSPFFEPGGAQ